MKWTKVVETAYGMRDANRDAAWKKTRMIVTSDGKVRSIGEVESYLAEKYARINKYRKLAGLDAVAPQLKRDWNIAQGLYEEFFGRPWLNQFVEDALTWQG